VEIPVKGKDQALEKLKLNTIPSIESEILAIYHHWMKTPATLSDVKKIRSIVYALLHRNIRWTEGFHHWMFALESLPLTQTQKQELATICIRQPFTGSGQTVPSYRIPILWENYLICIRNVLSPPCPAPPPQKQKVLTTKKKKNVTSSS